MRNLATFPPRLLLAFVGTAAGIFALSIYLLAFGGGAPRDAIGPTSFSRSAIGYAGYAEFLRRLKVPVVQSRGRENEAAEVPDLLILTEPPPSGSAEERRLSLGQVRSALVVLPKWNGAPDPDHPGWIRAAVLASRGAADRVIALAGAKGRSVRVPMPTAWSVDTLGVAPEVAGQVQLIEGSDLVPIVAAPEGILVGERQVDGRRIRILADPDILANHGITREANARFGLVLIEGLRGRGGRAVFDETVHGFRALGPNPFRLPFEFPFSIVTGLGAVAAALVLWSAAACFGRPEAPPEALPAGKETLIRNAARLIALSGRGEPVVAAYVAAKIREVGRVLRAPARLDEAGLVAWLDRAGRARGVHTDLHDLTRRADALRQGLAADTPALVRLAGDAHRWKRDILAVA